MFLGKLYPFQVEGAEFIINKKLAILQFEQGLGKTITALAAFEKLRELGKAKRCLIIGQASYLFQWEKTIEIFTNSSYIIASPGHERDYSTTDSTYWLISYNIFRNDFNKIVKEGWDCVICDEAQEFANNKSKTAKLVKRYNVDQNPPYRWALTGTAIRSKLEHLYSILYWVDRSFLPSWPTFEAKHIERDHTGAISGYKNLTPLYEHLKNRVHRKTFSDVEGNVPAVIGPVYHVLESEPEYLEAQTELLKALDRVPIDIDINDFISPFTKSQLSKAFNRCRKLLSGENKVNYLVKEIDKVLKENEKNRVVIFSYYKDPLYLLDKKLTSIGIESVRFTGDESAKAKRENIRSFSSNIRVLLASNAGYKGLDLPFANYVYHLDVPLTFEILDQRNKRVRRLSSTHKTVVINYLLTKGSIEKFYLDIVFKQGELLKAVFDESRDNVKIKSQTLRQYLNEFRDKDNRILSSKKGDRNSSKEVRRSKQRDKVSTGTRRTSDRTI